MRMLSCLIAVAALVVGAALPAGAEEAKPAGAAGHPFIGTDNGQGKVFRVSAAGQIEWEYPASQGQDVWVLPNGNYLFSHVRGVKEVTPDAEKKVVWEYQSPDGAEVHNCQPLPDGSVMVAECGTARIIEIGRDLALRKEIKIEIKTKGTHSQIRMARKLPSGNYLLALNGDHLVREYDAEGKVVRSIPVPGDPYGAVRLPSGNTLISCGDGHTFIEVDPTDKIVWQITENEIPGHPLRFVAGFQRLPNGNTVICNWGGHGFIGKQPQIFEITPDKKVVWQVEDHKQFKAFAGIQLLDVKGDVTRGEIVR